MAISDEIREQTVKLKDMDNKQKAEYIWLYYKWWIIGAALAVIIITGTIKSVVENSKPVYIDVIFLNSQVNYCTLENDFLSTYEVDPSDYNTSFDFVTYLDNDYGNQASMAGQIKLMAKYEAELCDIVCGPESTLTKSGDVGGYGNLEEILPDGMLDSILNKGYEPFYYTEKIYDEDAVPDADGNVPYTEGQTYIGGFYIDDCPVIVNQGIYANDDGDRHVLTIAYNTQNLEHAIEFINFITE